ncbi:lytic transglycosylase domain-containing protein [Zavarzinia sp.]|uniref:lytic transglycosylase domain-containing protein n=1 Tax=Zavarzinia sp. TaxID=2027920 RepID=UPI0035636A43
MRISTGMTALALVLGLAAQPVAAALSPAAAQTAPLRLPSLLSPADRQVYMRAFAAGSNGDWDEAASVAAAAKDRTLAKVIDWQRYQARENSNGFDEIAQFVERNPNWPRRSTTLARAEAAITSDTSSTRLISWFQKYPPVSGIGKLRYGVALMAAGDKARGLLMLRQGWVDADLDSDTEAQILAAYGDRLSQADHIARMNRLLMDEDVAEARRLMAYVPPADRAAANAAISFILATRSANADYAAVPADRRDAPGLLYARVRYLRSLDLDDQAVDLIASLPEGVAAQNPGRWWPHLRYAARRLLTAGRYQDAYRVARAHNLTEGTDYYEAEWTAGWIALRFLRQPEAALRHFSAMASKVQTPISVSRANYWAGRAAEAGGHAADARNWYGRAAGQPQTFYGQLAAFELGETNARPLPPDPRPSSADQAAAERDDLVRAIRMMIEIGEESRIRPFVKAAMENSASPGMRAMIAEIAAANGDTYAGVIAAKEASFVGTLLTNRGYPVLSMPSGSLTEPALALALTRQESEFRPDAVSPAGARGLMQLMPATAKLVAKKIGLGFDQRKLTSDPRYNMTLGVAHLDELLDDFAGSYAMVAGAYNAGGNRIDQWVDRNGDPRSSSVDVIDWIELIPFEETRNYVQRVIENTQVYRQRLAPGKPVPLGIAKDLLRGSSMRTTPVVEQPFRATAG